MAVDASGGVNGLGDGGVGELGGGVKGLGGGVEDLGDGGSLGGVVGSDIMLRRLGSPPLVIVLLWGGSARKYI